MAMQVLANSTPWDLVRIKHAVRYKLSRNIAMSECDMITNEEARQRKPLKLLDERIADEWQRRWTTSAKGRTTHRCIPNISVIDVAFDPPMKAGFIITGHGSLN